jgi:hypothetical protein
MNDDFWKKCIDNRCVIVPVQVYSQYDETGNESERFYVGMKFIALRSDPETVGPDYYYQIDESSTTKESLFDSPEDALNSHIEWRRKT